METCSYVSFFYGAASGLLRSACFSCFDFFPFAGLPPVVDPREGYLFPQSGRANLRLVFFLQLFFSSRIACSPLLSGPPAPAPNLFAFWWVGSFFFRVFLRLCLYHPSNGWVLENLTWVFFSKPALPFFPSCRVHLLVPTGPFSSWSQSGGSVYFFSSFFWPTPELLTEVFVLLSLYGPDPLDLRCFFLRKTRFSFLASGSSFISSFLRFSPDF